MLTWILFLLLPLTAQAANLPQPSDVVFLHDAVDEDKQDSFNYIYTVAGDDTIYTCQANRCSLLEFREQSTVDVTFYQLPEGYQRVASIVDQAVLQEYRDLATANYHFTALETELSASATTRSYHVVNVHEDGSYDNDTTSQERNADLNDDEASGLGIWLWVIIGSAIVVAAAAGWLLWKRRN